MNTTGIQNYLSNVFRPIYTWDATASNFTPKLEISNIDTYSGNVVAVFRADIADSASNVYVGSNAGNPFTTIRSCSNVTALGYGAGSNISNDSNSIYIGWYAGASGSNGSNVISIGKSSGQGNGKNNVFLGTGTGTAGQSNILIGHFIAPSNVSNQIRVGYSNQIPIAADLSKNWVGLGGVVDPTGIAYANVDVSGGMRVNGNLGVQITPGGRTLDVNGNFRSQDSSGNALDFENGITRSTKGFTSLRGTVSVGAGGGVATIGTLSLGILLASAQKSGAVGTDYDSQIVYVRDATGGSAPLSTSLGQNGDTHIVYSTSNIQISNSGITSVSFDYNITYFPLL